MLTLGCLCVAGLWVGLSNQVGPRTIRGLIAETTRSIEPPSSIPKPETWDQNAVTAARLGQSTGLIYFYGVHILTDTGLFRRTWPDVRAWAVRAQRLVGSALPAHQLP